MQRDPGAGNRARARGQDEGISYKKKVIINDLDKYIQNRKERDPAFAEGYDAGYQDFLVGILLKEPRIHADGLRPTPAYASYFQTYVERDVRQMLALRDASRFDKFLRLLAGRAGQVLNKHALAGDVGVDAKTIDHWLSILEASFIILKVRPWHENFGKRVIKSPKYYFVDAGLLVFLLGFREPAQVARDPLLGGIFENLVMAEGLK